MDRTRGYVELGRALMPWGDVVLSADREPEVGHSGLAGRACRSEEALLGLVDTADVTVLPATLCESVPVLARTRSRLVLDVSCCPALSRPTLRAGQFFLCASEAERTQWLPRLEAAGVVTRRQASGDLRRLIDVLAIDALADASDVDVRDRLVDPLRLFCTSSAGLPRGWAWAPPSRAARAWRVLRTEGARGLVSRANGRIRRRLGTRSRRPLRSARLAADRPATAVLPPATTIEQLHLALVARRLARHPARFIDLEIDVANRCNIRCRMCYFSFDEVFHARPAPLSLDTFRGIADRILPYARTVMLSLGSEPLLAPEFPRILDIAAGYEVPELGFYTNGLLLSGRLSDAVLNAGVTLVAISVDGATKRTFESIRRGADFDLLVRNVRGLVQRRSEMRRRHPRLRFGVTMMRRNIEELADIVTLAWRLGVEEVNFFHAVVYDGLEMDGESLVHHQALSDACLERALARAGELGIRVVHHPAPFGAGAGRRPATNGRVDDEPYCRFPFFHVSIDSMGRVRPCPFSHGEPPVGTVSRELPIDAIWLGPGMTTLRQRILANDPPPMCQRCAFLASSQPQRAELFSTRPH